MPGKQLQLPIATADAFALGLLCFFESNYRWYGTEYLVGLNKKANHQDAVTVGECS